MAENDQAQDNEAGKKGKLKTIIFVVLAILLAAGLSVGATLFFLDSGDETASDEEHAQPSEEVQPEQQPAIYLKFQKPLIVTLNTQGRQRYMQVSLALVARDPEAEKAFEVHRPLLRSRLLTLLGQQDFMSVQTDQGRRQLQDAILARVNEVLEQEGEPKVEKVLFTNFVLQ
ncbi:flagellar basal body-associated FliL family protein [Marinobacteraceae bacterium S3BR75-40.1]